MGPFYCYAGLGFRPRVFLTGSGTACSSGSGGTIVTNESSVAGFVTASSI